MILEVVFEGIRILKLHLNATKNSTTIPKVTSPEFEDMSMMDIEMTEMMGFSEFEDMMEVHPSLTSHGIYCLLVLLR